MNPTLTPITQCVARWAGVEIDPTHDAMAFRLDTHELARLSSSGDLTVPTTARLRDQLLTDGFADGVAERPDWVHYRIRSPADVPGAIRLLRVAYLVRRNARDPHLTPDYLRRLGASPELVSLLFDTDPGTDHDRQTA